jgi:hypothetical protein
MENLATEFFKDLYTKNPKGTTINYCRSTEEKINDQTNEGLCDHFTNDEIIFSLFQIGPTKAPGPAGFLPTFFQRN